MLQVSNKQNRPALSPVSAGQRVTRKYRKAYIRRLKQKEYKRLQAIVPNVARKEKVSKVTVIEEAIKYIDELHQALVDRLQLKAQVFPKALSQQFSQQFVGEVAKNMFIREKMNSTNTFICQNERRIPSYMTKTESISRTRTMR